MSKDFRQCFWSRSGSGFNQVSGSGFGIRIRIQEGKMTHKKEEFLKQFLNCTLVVLLEYFSAALSLFNLLKNSLGRSKPATRLMQAHQHTVWNISTISKPYWAAFHRNKMSTTRCEWVRLFISWQSSLHILEWDLDVKRSQLQVLDDKAWMMSNPVTQ